MYLFHGILILIVSCWMWETPDPMWHSIQTLHCIFCEHGGWWWWREREVTTCSRGDWHLCKVWSLSPQDGSLYHLLLFLELGIHICCRCQQFQCYLSIYLFLYCQPTYFVNMTFKFTRLFRLRNRNSPPLIPTNNEKYSKCCMHD